MQNYSEVLVDSIEREKKGIDYICPKADKELLRELLDEINSHAGTDYHYLAELDAFNIPGAGNIVAKFITEFSSEEVKGYLIPQMVSDKIKDCDKIVLQLYEQFRLSDEYVAKPGEPAPAHIYVRYDNAFKILKPKRLKKNLMEIAHSPRDAFYLPFTMRMLASWKMPEMKEKCYDWNTQYTVSCYVNSSETSGWTDGSSYGRFSIKKPDGSFISSEKYTTKTSGAMENGWSRISYTFTTAAAGSYLVGIEAGGFSGSYYADDLQIDYGDTAGVRNHVLNGKPNGISWWGFGNGASYDASTSSPFGAGVLKVVGGPEAWTSAAQDVPINEKGGTYIVSGWAKANAIGSTGTDYGSSKPNLRHNSQTMCR